MTPGDPSPVPAPVILVADDDAAKRLSIRAALEPLGHTIVAVDSGEAALRAVMEQEFAVILMDVKMPGMDGYETVRYIRMRDACERTPVIFITAYEPEEPQIPIAYASGVVDFICAPLDASVLRANVAGFVEFFVNRQKLEQSLGQVTVLSEQFRDSEARTRTLLDHVADGIVTVSDGGLIESFNRAATRIFGYGEQEAIGHAFAVMLASEHHDFTCDGEKAAELTGCRKDGSTFPMELDLSDIQVGARTTHIGCIRDVSDRHAYTENLARQALHFEALLEAAPDPTVIVDAAGLMVIVNERAVSSFGFTRDELIGQPVSILVPESFLGDDPGATDGCGPRASRHAQGRLRDAGGDQREPARDGGRRTGHRGDPGHQ